MPGQLSSPVCLTVIWFLSWSLCPVCRAHILTNEGVQYGRLGSNVTLACGTSPQRTAVQWHLSHTLSLPSHTVTSDGTLLLLRVDQSAQGNYSCYDVQGNLLHSVKLRLGNPPGKLNVSCRLPNHSLVRCSWLESVKTFLPAQYHAFYRGKGEEWKPCVVDPSLERCEITLPTFWQSVHYLNITVTNALGREQTFTQMRMDKLLKPDPPESVTVEGQAGHPTRLAVAWRYPSTWPVHSAFPLMFQIRYRPQGSTHWSEIESDHIPVLISDALAGYPHQVQVRAQDEVNSDSQWSEWSPLLLAWPWGAYNTPEPALEPLLPEEDFFGENFPVDINPETETSTAKTQNSTLDEDGNIGLVILLVLFSVVILTTVLSLILVMWMKQRRRDHVTKQELTSMVKMKSMPI